MERIGTFLIMTIEDVNIMFILKTYMILLLFLCNEKPSLGKCEIKYFWNHIILVES